MTRHRNDKARRDELEERRYQYDVARLAEWRKQEDQLRELIPHAIDVLGETLEAGGPEATKAALALVKMTGLAGKPAMSTRMLMGFVEDEELAAGLPESEHIPRITGGSDE